MVWTCAVVKMASSTNDSTIGRGNDSNIIDVCLVVRTCSARDVQVIAIRNKSAGLRWEWDSGIDGNEWGIHTIAIRSLRSSFDWKSWKEEERTTYSDHQRKEWPYSKAAIGIILFPQPNILSSQCILNHPSSILLIVYWKYIRRLLTTILNSILKKELTVIHNIVATPSTN